MINQNVIILLLFSRIIMHNHLKYFRTGYLLLKHCFHLTFPVLFACFHMIWVARYYEFNPLIALPILPIDFWEKPLTVLYTLTFFIM